MNKVDLLMERFVHRTDIYAEQWFDKNRGSGYAPKVDGWCTHTPKHRPKISCPDIDPIPLEESDIVDHVYGKRTLGLYQLDDNRTVKWLCFDIDINKRQPESVSQEELRDRIKAHTLAIAKELVKLKGKGTFLVEDTGNKGYHIWVFFDQPVDATLAQSVGMWINYKVEAPQGTHVEVFPKQDAINALGNLVKMPLGVHKKTKRRCLFVDSTFTQLDDQWAALENVETWTEDDLRTIRDTHDIKPPTRAMTAKGDAATSFTCMARIMEEGLMEGTRDAGIYRLSLYLRNRGFPQDVALSVAATVNEKSTPPMDAYDVETKVDSAYQSNYSAFPCSDQLINPYCSSMCRYWEGKVKEHWTRFGKDAADAVGVISRD
jgi:hypothetical protein